MLNCWCVNPICQAKGCLNLKRLEEQTNQLINNQKPLDPEFSKILNDMILKNDRNK